MTLESRLTALAQEIGSDVKAIYAGILQKADSNHGHSVATTNANGFMSTSQVLKLESSTVLFINSASRQLQTQNVIARTINRGLSL
jgi:hypothetical protein